MSLSPLAADERRQAVSSVAPMQYALGLPASYPDLLIDPQRRRHITSSGTPGLDRAWQERLPRLVEECAEQWNLVLEEPFAGGFVSHVVPAGDVVLKIQWPHRESEHEADALEQWDGEGAVRLLARDDARHALLLERCRPGTYLRERALEVLTGLLPRLWKPAGSPFRRLTEEVAWWASSIRDEWEEAGRPFEETLVDTAISTLQELAATQGEQVLLHQDLHPDNVLAAEREPWLVIDPKPLVGEREFGLAPIIRSVELGHSEQDVVGRLDRLSSDLGLDRERARGWALGQAIAWSFGSELQSSHVETARWLLQAER
jgi:streptomycin 6-kinase